MKAYHFICGKLKLTETTAGAKLTGSKVVLSRVVSSTTMNRLVTSFLIPLVLVSQNFCTAHSHVGTSVFEPDGHSERPHIHWDNGTHYDDHYDEDHEWHVGHKGIDSHDDCCSVIIEEHPADHDSGAFYVSDSPLFNDSISAKVDALSLSYSCQLYDASITDVGLRPRIEGGLPPPLRDLTCPLYLRILSIRL